MIVNGGYPYRGPTSRVKGPGRWTMATMERKTRRRIAWAFLFLFVSLPLACRKASTGEIVVFAAASTTDALREIAEDYRRAGGGVVAFSFGSSATLAKQIAAGAPADVFLSADLIQMNALQKAGFIRVEDEVDLLSNQLVVIVPSSSKRALAEPNDLAILPRVALADPESVPAGVYSKRWLESLGLWSILQPKVVPTVDVRAALASVESERVDAGIVYRTDAAISQKVRIAYAVPVEKGPKIVYPVARVASSKKRAAADFVAFLGQARAKAVFARYGFVTF